ncbi:hypothetical protein FHS22_000514 [Planomonospora venezuelensis]|uniref:Uncharacterized protein n=1 Tax=Planomonospora venezuelensis TaxID=1999 RepID=A0A841D168_PLAVE|nr:hypothetical protein [Planomonospora venezuelensis]
MSRSTPALIPSGYGAIVPGYDTAFGCDTASRGGPAVPHGRPPYRAGVGPES